MKSMLLVYYLLSTSDCGTLPASQTAEQTLVTSLLSGYNKNIRPDDQVSVDITASLQQIVSIDEKQQIMTSSSFISQTWRDDRLSWTPNSTNNFLKVVMIPVKTLWIPDTMVLNSADATGYLTISDYSLASIDNNGDVYMILPALAVKTRCDLIVQKFPFDRQLCTINLTSWSQGANRILYTEKPDSVIDISRYSEHPLWRLNRTDVISFNSSDRVPFEDTYNAVISIKLYLQRKPLFFMMNGIFACLILNCVTLLSYALPFGSQIGLCKSSFFSSTSSAISPSHCRYDLFHDILCLFTELFQSVSTTVRIPDDDYVVFLAVDHLDVAIDGMVCGMQPLHIKS